MELTVPVDNVKLSSSRRGFRGLNLIFFGLAAILLFGLLVWLVYPFFPALRSLSFPRGTPAALTTLVPSPNFSCNNGLPPTLPYSLYFISAGIASFAFGGYLGRYRNVSTTRLRASGRLLFQAALVIFFLLAALALGYEAFGTWVTGLHQDSQYQPITTFVRCGTQRYPWQVGALSCSACYLLGHWLTRRP